MHGLCSPPIWCSYPCSRHSVWCCSFFRCQRAFTTSLEYLRSCDFSSSVARAGACPARLAHCITPPCCCCFVPCAGLFINARDTSDILIARALWGQPTHLPASKGATFAACAVRACSALAWAGFPASAISPSVSACSTLAPCCSAPSKPSRTLRSAAAYIACAPPRAYRAPSQQQPKPVVFAAAPLAPFNSAAASAAASAP